MRGKEECAKIKLEKLASHSFDSRYRLEKGEDRMMNGKEQQIKEYEHQVDLQRLRGLRLIDDDFMRCLFKDNLPNSLMTGNIFYM